MFLWKMHRNVHMFRRSNTILIHLLANADIMIANCLFLFMAYFLLSLSISLYLSPFLSLSLSLAPNYWLSHFISRHLIYRFHFHPMSITVNINSINPAFVAAFLLLWVCNFFLFSASVNVGGHMNYNQVDF